MTTFINNTRKADGKVNCVGFFNDGGDCFFNLQQIELKLKQLHSFKAVANSWQIAEIDQHIAAAQSIYNKLTK